MNTSYADKEAVYAKEKYMDMLFTDSCWHCTGRLHRKPVSRYMGELRKDLRTIQSVDPDLGILCITFGLTIKITIASIIGIVIGVVVYRFYKVLVFILPGETSRKCENE